MADPKVIRVPKTPKSSFNKKRRPSQLLLDQIRHLEWAVLPASQRKPGQLPRATVRTEEEAATRIEQLTKMVLQANAPAPATTLSMTLAAAPLPPIVELPPLPSAAPAAAKRASRRVARKRASTKRVARPTKKAGAKSTKVMAKSTTAATKRSSKARTRRGAKR